MSTVEEFASRLEEALSTAIGPDTVKVAVSGSSEVDGVATTGFVCTVTLVHDLEFSAPTEALLEASAEATQVSAVGLATTIARQVSEPLGELAVGLAAAHPSAFVSDEQLGERIEEMLNKAEEVGNVGGEEVSEEAS